MSSRFYPIPGTKLEFPSVTTITAMLSKPALQFFYGKHGTAEASRISKEGREIGDWVHEYRKNYFLKKVNPGQQVHPKYLQSVRNFHAFVDKFNPKSVLLEKFVYSLQFGYAGTLDDVHRIGKKNVLLDFKSSNSIWDDYELQVVAYFTALAEMVMRNQIDFSDTIDEVWIVRLPKDEEINLDLDDPKCDVHKVDITKESYEISMAAFFRTFISF
jgi:hypothetical protein